MSNSEKNGYSIQKDKKLKKQMEKINEQNAHDDGEKERK